MTDFFCNGGYISFTGLSIFVMGLAIIIGLLILLFHIKKQEEEGGE